MLVRSAVPMLSILAAAEQFARRNLVEDRGHLVGSGLRGNEVVLELLRGVLELPEVVANQCHLMCAGQRHGVRDFHRGVLALEHSPSLGRKSTQVGLARTLEWKRRFVIRGSASIAGVECLNPLAAVVPPGWIMARHEDRRGGGRGRGAQALSPA